MKVKVTQSEAAIVRLVSLVSYEKPTHVSIELLESNPDAKSLVFYRKLEDVNEHDMVTIDYNDGVGFAHKKDLYHVVNDIAIDCKHFPTLDPRKKYKISDLEVPDEWKSVE